MTGKHMDRRKIGQRIRSIRKSRSVERKAIASVLGADVSYVTKIEKGGANFTIDKLLKIAEHLNVPPYEFFADEPLVPKPVADKQPIIVESFPDTQTHDEFRGVEAHDDFIPVRIIGTASLGQGRIVSGEETKGYALIYRHALNRKAWHQKRNAEKIVCLWAEGSSMLPTIQDKSLIAVDIEDIAEIKNQKIYIVELPDNEITIKRVHRTDNHLILFADNKDEPGYPKCIALGNSHSPIRGRVVWTWNVLE
jgi:transcriptional regulator with XRE-family HTH domain